MRNIFDQYSQPENRITHALISALNEDRGLLDNFLEDIARQNPTDNSELLYLTEQRYPWKTTSNGADETEVERRGIPDAWITAGDDWCLVIENKVLSTPSIDQLERHLATARSHGFSTPKGLLLAADRLSMELPDEFEFAMWGSVYKWLLEQESWSEWAQRLARYLEVMEARLTNLEQMGSGALTAFNGFRFGGDVGFSDHEAKRVLRLAMDQLRERSDLPSEIGIDLRRSGRKALRGSWDVLIFASSPKDESFTARPHLTLGIEPAFVSAMVTLPQNARKARRRLVSNGEDGFQSIVKAVLANMRAVAAGCPGMEPRVRVQQRHWTSRSAPPLLDALIDVDLRTYGNSGDSVKFQPQWIDAIYGAFRKKNANLELQIGAKFPYSTCKRIQESNAVDYVAEAWISCRPFISVLGLLDHKSNPEED